MTNRNCYHSLKSVLRTTVFRPHTNFLALHCIKFKFENHFENLMQSSLLKTCVYQAYRFSFNHFWHSLEDHLEYSNFIYTSHSNVFIFQINCGNFVYKNVDTFYLTNNSSSVIVSYAHLSRYPYRIILKYIVLIHVQLLK
jgi:hypothetical protein